ncbi:glycoside hydrolase family 16 protein, partial [Periconia macrospinosa]
LVTLSTLSSLPTISAQQKYTLKDDLSYKNFFSSFDFFSSKDPTNGFVQYQTRAAAVSSKLVGYFNDTSSVFMGVDHTTKDPKGRASVRLESKKTFNQGLLVADIRHMPDSICGSWPAFWMLGVGPQNDSASWPKFGEIDILEGTNDYTSNAVTLHTEAGCAISNTTSSPSAPNGASSDSSSSAAAGAGAGAFMGTIATPNCDVKAPGQLPNVGCSIKAPTSTPSLATYGTDFNSAGGGVYAMEWTSSSITVWFFPRNSSTIATVSPPSNSTSSSSQVNTLDTKTFGKPLARFAGPGCDYGKKFDSMKIIFNTALCGDWAGKEWDRSCKAKTGVATCEEYVRENPQAFSDAYWEVAGLKWFE